MYNRIPKFCKNNSRKAKINRLNCYYTRLVHQGKTFVRVVVTKFHINYFNSEFTSTRKPFFFRSKKKKKIG